ncbi:MAG: hypothetical protein GYA48_06220 [Chloroflexi bacterium]|nr:hypothetical protein [Chloroflexota bacterium]
MEKQEQKKEQSVWTTGAKIAAVFTVLAAIGSIARKSNSPVELTMGALLNFAFWWLVCSFFVWVYRKITNLLFNSKKKNHDLSQENKDVIIKFLNELLILIKSADSLNLTTIQNPDQRISAYNSVQDFVKKEISFLDELNRNWPKGNRFTAELRNYLNSISSMYENNLNWANYIFSGSYNFQDPESVETYNKYLQINRHYGQNTDVHLVNAEKELHSLTGFRFNDLINMK